jgi:hypothetical protein
MRTQALWTWRTLSVVSLVLSCPRAAVADVSREVCVGENLRAQSLRKDAKLTAARAALATCVDRSCPAVIRDDCAQRMEELERATPTVVVVATDDTGNDFTAVTVDVDGTVVATSLAGSAIPLDPGSHTFTFTAEGRPKVTRSVLLVEGDKSRRLSVVMGGAGASLPGEPLPSSNVARTAGILVGSAGVAGVIMGAIFGGLTISEASAQRSDCMSATNCRSPANAQSDHTTGLTDSAISTVGFIGGGALVALGVILLVTSKPASGKTVSGFFAPGIGSDGLGATWGARF